MPKAKGALHTNLYGVWVLLGIKILFSLQFIMLQLLKGVTANRTQNQMMETTFRIGAYDIPPIQTLITKPDGSFNWTGSIPTLLLGIMDTFKMKYSIVPLNIKEVKKFGTTKSAVNQLIYDEVDIAPAVFVPSVERASIMEFSFPIAMDSWRLCTPKPGEESRLFAFIGPFQPTLWFIFFLAIALTVFILSGLAKTEKAISPKENTEVTKDLIYLDLLKRFSMYVFTIILNQGNSIKVNNLACRIFLVSWLLAATVLINSYSGTLISHLTVPKLKDSIKTIEDLAKSNDVIPLLGKDTVLTQKILNASSGVYKILGNKVRQNPSSLIATAAEFYSKLGTMGYSFPVMESVCYSFIGADFDKTGTCRFEVSDTLPISQYGTLGLKKGGKYNRLLSYRILLFWEMGIVQRELSAFSKAKKCLGKTKNSTKQTPIQLTEVGSAFFLLGIGIALSVLSLIE